MKQQLEVAFKPQFKILMFFPFYDEKRLKCHKVKETSLKDWARTEERGRIFQTAAGDRKKDWYGGPTFFWLKWGNPKESLILDSIR